MTGLRIIQSLPMTDAMLIGTDVPENDFTGTIQTSHPYKKAVGNGDGDRVVSTTTHKVYECISDYTSPSVIGTSDRPENDATHWLEVGPTNRWKLFDDRNLTSTAQANSFYYRIQPGTTIGAVYPVGLVGCTSVRVRLIDPTYGTVYDKTADTSSTPKGADWFSFFFADWTIARRFAAFADLPAFPNAELRVDFTGTSALSCAKLVFGQMAEFGIGIQAGAEIGIKDFSRKDTTQFGDPEYQQGEYAPTNKLQFPIWNDEIDAFYDFMASIRATPVLFSAGTRAVLNQYGAYEDFRILISYTLHSDAEVSILALT